MSSEFTHLHVHTEFSMLDGAARGGELVDAAVADGQTSLGITDHGNLYGILDFYRACRDRGIKPILGTEAYMAHDTRFERPSRRGRSLPLRLFSRSASLEGPELPRLPRIDFCALQL